MLAQKTSGTLVRSSSRLVTLAWLGTLLASFFTNVLWIELFSGDMLTGFSIRLGIVLGLLLLTLVWQTSAPLRRYWLVLLALLLGEVAAEMLMKTSAWNAFFTSSSSWLVSGLGQQLPRLLLSLSAWLALVLMGMKRREYFLVMGQLDAPSEPVPWLGEKTSRPWTQYGRQFAVVLFIVTLVILGLGARPSVESLAGVLPLIPAILLFAALNSFNENFAARASLLPHLLPVLGKGQSLLLTAVFFGLWHFYGIPPGIGILLPIFLGWVSAKAMVETNGFFWSWMIQFPLDVIVFTLFAVQFVSGR